MNKDEPRPVTEALRLEYLGPTDTAPVGEYKVTTAVEGDDLGILQLSLEQAERLVKLRPMLPFSDGSVEDARDILTGLIATPLGNADQETALMNRIVSQMEVIYNRVLWARNADFSQHAEEREE